MASPIKAGYKTSEFWFTLVSFIFSGLYLSGVIGDNQVKEDLIQETSKGLEATILIGGQLIVLCRYIRGRTELKKLWWNTASEEERLAIINKGDKHGPKPKRKSKKSTKPTNKPDTRNETSK